MSQLMDRLNFLTSLRKDRFAGGHGQTTIENRDWEDVYRRRWQHDKIVRSTHGVNCTGSCSWKIYVKSGIVTWETQQTDYPRTRPDLPNHEPRGCSRGASYSWYLYSGNRVKYPLARSRLLRLLQRTAHWLAEGRVNEDGAVRLVDWMEALLRRESYLAMLLERPSVHERLLRLLGAARSQASAASELEPLARDDARLMVTPAYHQVELARRQFLSMDSSLEAARENLRVFIEAARARGEAMDHVLADPGPIHIEAAGNGGKLAVETYAWRRDATFRDYAFASPAAAIAARS